MAVKDAVSRERLSQLSKEMVRLYVSEMKSIPQVASSMSLPRSTVRSALLRAGVELRSRADGVRLAKDRLGGGFRGKKRSLTPEWREAISQGRLRHSERHARGFSLKPSGYIEITKGEHKGRGQHVVAMEDFLGRRLGPDEVVHHEDEDRSNNSLLNLEVMTRSEHSRLHRLAEMKAGMARKRGKDGRFL